MKNFINKKNIFKGEKAIFDFINPENYYTPLIELPQELNPFKKFNINIFVKISWFNPLLNIKLIPAYWMLKNAKESNKLNNVNNLIEASSGNMAYSIQILSKYFGIKRFVALVSNKVSKGKRKILDLLGIKYIIRKEDICPDPEDPKSSINLAKKFRNRKGWYNLGQYDNEDNFWGHYYLTGKQIYEQLNGDIDIVSIGLGTTGTLIGVSKYLKEKIKNVIIIGVIRHKNNLVPGVRTLNLLKEIKFNWQDYVDYKVFVGSKESYLYSLKLIRRGLLCGPSSGFAFFGLIDFIKNNKNIVRDIIKSKGYVNSVFISPDTFLPYIDEYFECLKIKDNSKKQKINDISINSSNISKKDLSISSDHLKNIVTSKEKENWLLIDIRNEIRFKDSHIVGSINIPYEKLIKNWESLLKTAINKKIVFICDFDIKSEILTNYIKNKYPQIQVFYLKGGISEWSIKNYPREGNICSYPFNSSN